MIGFHTCDFPAEANTGTTSPRSHQVVHKHYIIVRPDLPVGLLAAQVTHAAGESAALRTPPAGCHAVVLAASEAELHRLARLLPEKCIPFRAVYEDTAPYEDALMAIGIAPMTPEAHRWLSHLPLLRRCGPA